jgi:hypothetical protein
MGLSAAFWYAIIVAGMWPRSGGAKGGMVKAPMAPKARTRKRVMRMLRFLAIYFRSFSAGSVFTIRTVSMLTRTIRLTRSRM